MKDRFNALLDSLVSIQAQALVLNTNLCFGVEIAEWHRWRSGLEDYALEIQELRASGYAWWPALEESLCDALERAPMAHADGWFAIDRAMKDFLPRVQALLRNSQSLLFSDDFTEHPEEVEALRRELDFLDAGVKASVNLVQLAQRPVVEALQGLQAVMSGIREARASLRESGIPLYQPPPPLIAQGEEHALVICEATWKDHPEGEREGHLLLTDQRVLFGQELEGPPPSILVLIDQPWSALDHAEGRIEGIFFLDYYLTLIWQTRGVLPPSATLQVRGRTPDEWVDLIRSLQRANTESLLVRPEEALRLQSLQERWMRFLVSHRSLSGARATGAPTAAILHDLLVQLFDAEELKRFIGYTLAHQELLRDLPGTGASPAMVFFEATSGLISRGLVTPAFFDALRVERPGKSEYIAEAQKALGG